MIKKILHFLGSIQLAVPLLAAIASILIWATFYEAQVGTSVVQQEIYKSAWFGALMFLLAVNLGLSALSRYPWRGPRKMGFALTHLGIIVLIAGCAAVIHLGVEGMLFLRTDIGTKQTIRLEGDRLEVATPDSKLHETEIFIKSDRVVKPHAFAGLEAIAYSENTVETVSFSEGETVRNPAVRLSLKSDRMAQTLDRWLAVAPATYSQVPLGPADLKLIQVESETELQKLLNASTTQRTGKFGSLTLTTESGSQQFEVEKNREIKVRNAGKEVRLKIVNFWPDFQLDRNNQPSTASDQVRNPAVQLEVSAPNGVERWFLFGREDFPPIRSVISGEALENIQLEYQIDLQQYSDYFQVIVAPDNRLFYTANSSQEFKSGGLEIGNAVSPGWADFKITLEEFIPNAQIARRIVPLSEPTIDGVPGLLVQTVEGQRQWLRWGEPTVIPDRSGQIFAAFGPSLLNLPFAIALEDFIVERNEGSDSVAMWTSKIRIKDGDRIVYKDVWMNHPAWYRGWKIAQASWNPGDLQQSTLQVKREPIWVTALTWGGSCLIIAGIAVMFYGPAIAKTLRQRSPEIGTPTVEETAIGAEAGESADLQPTASRS